MTIAYRYVREQQWRFWLLILLLLTSVAGVYALRMSTDILYVGELNASNDAMITWQQNNFTASNVVCIRDASSGEVLLDLADIGVSYKDYIGWHSKNRNLIAVVPGDNDSEREVVEIEIQPTARIVQSKKIRYEPQCVAFIDPQGRLLHAAVQTELNQQNVYPDRIKPSFTLYDEHGKTIRRVEFGRDETVYLSPSRDGKLLKAHFRALRSGDNIYTDGISTGVLHLDSTTGETIREYQGVFSSIWLADELIAVPVPPGWHVVSIDQPDETVVKIGKGIPLRVDENTLATYDSSTQGKLTRYSISDGAAKVTALPTWGQAQVTSGVVDGDIFVVTKDWLQRMDVVTGEVYNLQSFRPWFKTTQAIALAGLPVFAILWLAFAARRNDTLRTLEVATVLLACIGVLVFWTTVPSIRANGLQNVAEFAIFVQLGAMVTIALVWVSTLRSVWAHGVPLVTLASSALLTCFVAWKGGQESLLFVVVFALFIFCFSTGLRLLSTRGITPLRTVETASKRKPQQFSLLQIGISIASFAILFVAMRSIRWGEQIDAGVLRWYAVFTILMAIVMLVSVVAGASRHNIVLAAFAWIVGASALIGGHFWLSPTLLVPKTVQPAVHLIGQTSSLIVFVAVRYCRGVTSNTSEPPAS